jgi:dihydrofolate synthase/folylpolyglutamate synthase
MPSVTEPLEAWLAYIERLHHRPIDLGLERVRRVAQRMGLDTALDAVRVLVGGTNGKGSTCAMLDAMYRAAGYRVGRYGSPHLLRFNERASIDGQPADDAQLVARFAAVEQARGVTTLTYFEFSTLAVLSLFAQSRLDIVILEVGLGGRLDAVNIVDADCAIVTTIDLDHTELLGNTREEIGLEKAHIFRGGRPAICVDPDPPVALLDYARRVGASLRCLGGDFWIQVPALAQGRRQWSYHSAAPQGSRRSLPWPALRGAHQLRNAAGALAVIEALAERCPVDQQAVRRGLASVQLAGRFQVIPGRPRLILDVAHNGHAARALAQALRAHALPDAGAGTDHRDESAEAGAPAPGARTLAVFGMLRDKDARAVVQALEKQIDGWYLASTAGERGQDAGALAHGAFAAPPPARCHLHDAVAQALDAAMGDATPDDRIIVFGSFVIVADALRWLERSSR